MSMKQNIYVYISITRASYSARAACFVSPHILVRKSAKGDPIVSTQVLESPSRKSDEP